MEHEWDSQFLLYIYINYGLHVLLANICYVYIFSINKNLKDLCVDVNFYEITY